MARLLKSKETLLAFFLILVSATNLLAQRKKRWGLNDDLKNPGTYSIVTDDPNRLHRLSILASPFNFTASQPVSINVGLNVNYTNLKYGAIKVGLWTSSFFSDYIEDKPFGEDFRREPDFVEGFFDESEFAATVFFKKKVKDYKYKIRLRSYRGSGNTTIVLVQPVDGELNVAYGAHFGMARQHGSFYSLIPGFEGVAGIYGCTRNVFFFGLSKATWGTMVIDHSRYGIRGGTNFDNMYVDLLFAPQQNIHYLLNQENEKAATFNPLSDIKRFPLGFRWGMDFSNGRNTGSFVTGGNLEIGMRPSYLLQYNEIYLGIKIGLGAGFIRTSGGSSGSSHDRFNEDDDAYDSGKKSKTHSKSVDREEHYNDARKYQNKGSYKRGKGGKRVYKKPKRRFG